MRMFLIGEGPTDCGKLDYSKKENHGWIDGPVQIYIHKAAPELQIDTYDKSKLKSSERKTHRNRRSIQDLDGHGEKAFFIAQLAAEEGYDITAMYVDADKTSGSTQKNSSSCQRRYDLVKEDVLAGLKRGGASRPLAIVPMKMIECWILGDRNAFIRVYGEAPDPAQFKNPELLWGKEDDPKSDYPKNRLTRILAQCHDTRSQDSYVRIAEESELQTMCQSCPISFADFISQLSAYI